MLNFVADFKRSDFNYLVAYILTVMENINEKHIQDFISFFKTEANYDFSNYSLKSFTRRLVKLVEDSGKSLPEIVEDMQQYPELIEETIKKITVNTTELFRNPQVWRIMRKDIIPKYVNEEQINIWHPGVSTGQEAYSLMVLLDEVGLLDRCNITGTDINEDVLKIARTGKYKYREIDEYIKNYSEVFDGTSSPPIKNYFTFSKRKNLITVNNKLLPKIEFLKNDLLKTQNPNNFKYHLIVCRNLLIYFNHETQNRIFKFFHDILHKNGTLIIGRHESILSDIASCFEKRSTIYIKKELKSNYNKYNQI